MSADGGVKQTLRGHALMSAYDRKRTSGQRSLNERAAEGVMPLDEKNCEAQERETVARR
jgi:hypothetical protein